MGLPEFPDGEVRTATAASTHPADIDFAANTVLANQLERGYPYLVGVAVAVTPQGAVLVTVATSQTARG